MSFRRFPLSRDSLVPEILSFQDPVVRRFSRWRVSSSVDVGSPVFWGSFFVGFTCFSSFPVFLISFCDTVGGIGKPPYPGFRREYEGLPPRRPGVAYLMVGPPWPPSQSRSISLTCTNMRRMIIATSGNLLSVHDRLRLLGLLTIAPPYLTSARGGCAASAFGRPPFGRLRSSADGAGE